MSFKPVHPTLAREYFKKRSVQSFYALSGTFILLAVLFSWIASPMFESFVPLILGNVLAGIIAYSAYLFWNRRPMQIRCLGCRKTISCRTPWVCGECGHENWDVRSTTILDDCSNSTCGLPAKAYLCHHCGEPVFLSKDLDKTNPARRIGTEGRDPRLRAEKQRLGDEGFGQQKTDLEREVEKAKLVLAKEQVNAQIEVVKKGLTLTDGQIQTALDIQVESLKKFMDVGTAISEAARRQKALNAQECKDNPTERRRRDLLVDEWVRRQLAKTA